MKRMPRAIPLIFMGLLASGCAAPQGHTPSSVELNASALWGAEITGQIHSAFYLPEQHLYGEEIGPGRGKPRPAFLWPSSIMLSALVAAARVDPGDYRPLVREYVDALRAYRTTRNGITGLDVWPAPKPPDRYYDDNAWMALALAEAYQVTHEPRDLQFADEALRFALSGEDAKLGGGIYWHEDRFENKHTVSTAPAAAAAIELYIATGKPFYLDTGKRLYAWTAAHLQDPDGLYGDSIAVADGKVDWKKYAYNSGTMIRAACLLHRVTHDPQYLTDAQRTARAAERYWVRAADGAIRDEAALAHKLCEAFFCLHDEDHDQHWLAVGSRALNYIHSHARDPNGWYGRRWDDRDIGALDPIRLLDQASAARAFWMSARPIP